MVTRWRSHCIEGVVYIAVVFAAKTNAIIPLVVIDLIGLYKFDEFFCCSTSRYVKVFDKNNVLFYYVRKIKVSDMESECLL